jgi:hypothetical protein
VERRGRHGGLQHRRPKLPYAAQQPYSDWQRAREEAATIQPELTNLDMWTTEWRRRREACVHQVADLNEQESALRAEMAAAEEERRREDGLARLRAKVGWS